MVVITMAYPQPGFLLFDKNAITPSNHTQRFRFPSKFQRNNLHISRKPRTIRKTALVTANSAGVIEKEHEFKPSFEEYLKAMETVKSRREKRKTDEEIVESSDSPEQIVVQKVANLKQDEVKKKWTRKKLDSKVAQIVGKTEEKDVEFQGQSFNLKRGSEIRAIISNNYGMDAAASQERFAHLKNDNYDSMKQEEVKKKWVLKKVDSKETQIGSRVKAINANGIRKIEEQNVKYDSMKQDEVKKKWVLKKSDSNETQMGVRFKAIDTNEIRKSEEEYVKFRGSYDGVDKERVVHMKKMTVKSEGLVKDDKYGSVGVERAAFKSLEEFKDVCDQPRVSRVDMEERIQRLAKCLNGASVDTPEWNFSKMMRSAKIRFADFSMIRLIQILGNYGNWRRVLQVIEWMQARERFKSNRIRNIYTAALDALGKSRRPVEAFNMFHTMQQNMSSYPDIIAYRCVAVTLGQAGHMRELFHVIDSMRSPPKKKLPTGVLQKWDPRLEPDIIVYNAVLNACVRQKNPEGAFWVLQELKQQCQQPNTITYGLVMEVMLACEKYNLVHEFFKKMQKSFIPNSLTYKVLVNTLWKEGKVDEAILAVKEMERRGIIGSAGLYYDLARCLCSVGRCKEALVQIEKICKVASKPLVVTYTGLIQTCLDFQNIESGIYIFNHMRNFCSPNLVTYNIILKGYLDHHMFEEARDLFHKLLNNGNNVTNKVDYKCMVLPDTHTFNLMLDACFVNQRWDDLEFVYTTMLQHGFYFNAKRHSRMILEACKAGKVNLLETTWNHLIKGDQIPPPLLVQEMFRVKLKQDDYAAAFSCVVCVPSSESHKYSRDSWVRSFRDDPCVFTEERLLRLVDEIHKTSLGNEEPNMLLLNLMKSCKEIIRTQ